MFWKLVRLLVFSNVWIGIGCAAQVTFTFLMLGEEPDYKLLLMAGFGTVAVYNWQRLVRIGGKVPEIHSERHHWMEANRRFLWILTIASSIVATVQFLYLDARSILITLGLGVVAFLYTLPWFSGSRRAGLRELPYLKLMLIAVCWVGITVLLPIISLKGETLVPLLLIERALFMLAITIPFDIRDLQHDGPEKRTMPQVLGIRRARALALIFWIAAACCMIFLLTFLEATMYQHLAVMIGYVITGILISGSRTDSQELYYTGAMDGTLILIPLLFFIT